MANVLQQVKTYNESALAYLLNSYAFISTSNGKFKNFENLEANLGDAVEFDKPPRFNTNGSQVASFQDAEQRVQTLEVNNPESVSYQFSSKEFIYNARDYMDKWGKAATIELGNVVEKDIASVAETHTFRYFGDGKTQISSFLQLADMLAQFREFGSAKENTKGYLDTRTYPRIVNNGLNQFVPSRNETMAMSWEVGSFDRCEWYSSNMLPVHEAGTEGVQGSTLTVVSTTKDSNGAITSITFSGTNAKNDSDSVKKYDKFQFSDISSQPNLRFKTYIGDNVTQNPVQFSAASKASSDGSNQVTVSLFPALQPNLVKTGDDININNDIVAGMQATVLPDHRCGLITGGNPLFIAIPRLPATDPFPSAISTDPSTGCSLRTYYGERFGLNKRGIIHDVIWGKTLVEEYSMMVALPV